jgi:AcrR family transcriptional regulator
MDDTTTMRRIPKQARSQQRVQHLVNTAAQVFAEVGYEAATTNAIAARAGVPIGSLYQFFPDKDALLQAVIAAQGEALTIFMSDPLFFTLPLDESIERLLRGMAVFEREHPGFKALFGVAGLAPQVHHGFIKWVEGLFAHRFPEMDTATRHLGATISVAIVKGLMPLSAPPDSIAPETLLVETKTALVAYIRALTARQPVAHRCPGLGE